MDSWIKVAVLRLRDHRAPKTAGADVNPPIPSTTSGSNSSHAAAHPRVYCKVSSLSSFVKMPKAPDQVSFYAPTLDVLWGAFGEDRLFFGSDWPVSARNSDYATMMRVVREYFGAKGRVASEKFFWRNSQAAYRWVPRTA